MKKRYLGLVVAFVLALSTPVMASENETAIIPETEDDATFIEDVVESDTDEEIATTITDGEEVIETANEQTIGVDEDAYNWESNTLSETQEEIDTMSISEPIEDPVDVEEAIEEESELLKSIEDPDVLRIAPSSITVEAGDTFELTAEFDNQYIQNEQDIYWMVDDYIGVVADQNLYFGKNVVFKACKPGTFTVTVEGFDSKNYKYCKAKCEVTVTIPEATVRYRTHVQKIGWQPYVQNGELSGTTGQSLRLEAINIDVSGNPLIENHELDYQTHVQTYGWQRLKQNNEMAGTSGEGKRLEAIRIRLHSEYYNIYYQTHVQNFGWTGWACNGEECGSAGYGYRLEGIRIKIVRKGEPAPGDTSNRYYLNPGSWAAYESPHPKMSGASIGYNTHVQSYGWQNYVYDGAMSGTSGESKRLEAIQIQTLSGGSATPPVASGNIVYRTHVQSYGWQSWMQNGQPSGTFGEAKRLEGIQIYMTGNLAKYYDIYYCVHAQTYGWLDWAKNGEMAGTSGLSKRLEGIKILLVEKGGKTPGATARPYVLGPGGSLPDNPYVEPI